MGTPEAYNYSEGVYIDYTPSSALTGGTVVSMDGGASCGIAQGDVAADVVGSLQVRGLVKVQKIQAAMSAGLPVWYDDDGSPYGGTASSGCATLFGTDGDTLMGSVAVDAAATDTHVIVRLNEFSPAWPISLFANRVMETKAANYTVDAQDTGKTIFVATDAVVITLPATADGIDVVVVNLAADGTALISLDPNANDKIMGPDIAGTDNKDLQNTKLTQVQGDFVYLEADGGDGWAIKALRGTWATEAG